MPILPRSPWQAWYPWDSIAAGAGLAPERQSQQKQQQVEVESMLGLAAGSYIHPEEGLQGGVGRGWY